MTPRVLGHGVGGIFGVADAARWEMKGDGAGCFWVSPGVEQDTAI